MSMKELFYFSKSDRKAILFLFVAIVVIFVAIRWSSGLSITAEKPTAQQRKPSKQAVSSHIKPYFLQNNLYAAIQPTGRNEKWRANQKKAFHSRL